MPDEKNDTNRKKPGRSGATKPPVIDLQARKVGEEKTKKPADEGAGAAAARPADKAGGKTGDKAAAPTATDKPKQPGKSEQPGKSAPGTSADSGGKPGRPEKSASSSEAGSTSAKDGRKSRTGLKLLLGLLALGGAAGGGAWLYQQYGPEKAVSALQQRLAAVERKLAASERAAALAGEVAALKNRLQQMQKEQAALAATVREMSKSDGGELPLKVRALEERLAALEGLPARVEELGKRTQALDKTIAALSEQMNTLRKTLADMASGAPAGGQTGVASGATAGAGVAAAIAALKLSGKQLEQKLANLAEQLDEVRKSADPARLKALEARLGKQEEALIRAQDELRALAQRATAAAEKAARQAAAATAAVEELRANPPVPEFTPPPEGAAYATLREKVNTGQPFKAELEKLAALMPGAPGLDALAAHAERGVPTLAALSGRLAALKDELARAAQPERKSVSEDPLGALKGKLMQMVKVRRAGEPDWPKTLAAMQARLREAGLAAALAELTPYKDKLPQSVAQWATQARARLTVDKALDQLAEAVLKRTTRGK